MDDSFFVLLGLTAIAALVLGPTAFFLVLGARSRNAETQRQLRSLEARVDTALLKLERLASGVPQDKPEQAPEPSKDSSEEEAAAATRSQAGNTASVTGEAEVDKDAAPDADTPASGEADEAAWQWPETTGTKTGEQAEPELTVAAAKPAGPGLEERLGTRWTVWVGGVALAFGALLLVRYAIDQGFFGPGARVLLGLALAAVLIGAGEKMRRQEMSQTVDEAAPLAGFARPSIPAMLTAAGTIAGFGAIYAAHALYGFIGPALAFIALGITAVATMFAAALHGPMLAGLGLSAAMGVPLLVTSSNPSAWPVVLYLAVAAAAAYALARLRSWLWLALAAATGAGLWTLILLEPVLSSSGPSIYTAALAHLVLQTAMALYVFAFDPYRNASKNEAGPEAIPTIAAAGIGAVAVITFGAATGANFTAVWMIAATLVPLFLVAAGLAMPQAILSAIAGAVSAIAALLVWPWAANISGSNALAEIMTRYSAPVPLNAGSYGTYAVLISAIISGATMWKVLRNGQLALAPVCIFAGTATLTPILALLAVYLRFTTTGVDMLFAAMALGLAAAFTTCAQVFRKGVKDHQPLAWDLGQGICASAAIAALAIGLTMALDGGTLTIALGLAALGAAFVAIRLDIAALRWCVAGIAVALALRFVWEPGITPEIGSTPVFNWLLAGYGIPALCFGLAARMMRRAFGEDKPVRIAQAMAIMCAALLVYFEIRHYSFGDNILYPHSGLVEQGLFAIASIGFAIVLMRLDGGGKYPVFRYGSYLFGIISAGIAVLGLCVLHNPFWRFWHLGDISLPGGVAFNPLLLSYLLPGAMALLLGRMADGIRPRWYVMGARIIAMVLIFAYLSLQVRRVFQGPVVSITRHTGDGEWYTYSAVWLVFGICLLAYGLWRKSVEVRIASAIFIVLSVVKVFLFDLAGLDGILRALSFIGLGGVLIGIGLVYQKYVFARPAQAGGAKHRGPDIGQ